MASNYNFPIEEAEFLVINFETITPRGRSPEPIELGILNIKNNEINEKIATSTFILPPDGLKLTSFDIKQTGIKDIDLKNKESADIVIRKLNEFCIKHNFIFIAHNAKYKNNILSHYSEGNKVVMETPMIDTIPLAKYKMPNLENYKLDTIAENLKIEIPIDRHRALSDCYLTAKIFLDLLKIDTSSKMIKSTKELLDISGIVRKKESLDQIRLDL